MPFPPLPINMNSTNTQNSFCSVKEVLMLDESASQVLFYFVQFINYTMNFNFILIGKAYLPKLTNTGL